MPLDTSSFSAYLRSLNIISPVTTKSGRMVGGPPAPIFEAALRAGLGPLVLDTQRNRTLMASLGVQKEYLTIAARRLRSRSQWRSVWMELAAPHIAAMDDAVARRDRGTAVAETETVLALLRVAYGGDGYYIHTPMSVKGEEYRLRARLHKTLYELRGERVERISIAHARGSMVGLLHFPPHSSQSPKPLPALLAIHPLAGDKESFDHALTRFREAGYATFCMDLPAHGENLDGPRLKPDDEVVAAAALETLAVHPEIDSDRIGVMGGSLGAFYALRTAAVSPLAKVCLAYASPFDAGKGIPESVFGIQDVFAHVIGAPSIRESFKMAKPFHLRDMLQNIRCPVCLVHGTQDHICDFTANYEVARRVRSPLTVVPLLGVDHEAAMPSAEAFAKPGEGWVREHL